jgi:hypothetical protein
MRALALAAAPLVLTGWAGCRGFERDTGPYSYCDPVAVPEGRARARRIPCDDEAIDGGEALRADYLIENARARYGVRHPGAPLTLLEGGGGTVIDAAAPGDEDLLAELVPLVGQGWLEQTRLVLEQGPEGAAIHIHGDPRPLRVLEGWLDGEVSGPVTVSYRLGPDDPVLSIEGADAFWLLPRDGAELAGTTLRRDGRMLAFDGVVEDLGGGLLVRDAGRVAVGAPSEVMAALWPGGERVSGVTEGDGVEILAGGAVVGWLPVAGDGGFEGVIPLGADGLRALAEGHTPGPVVPVDQRELPLGDEGRLGLRIVDRAGQPLSALVRARDRRGEVRWEPVPSEGAWLPLGAGEWTLEVDAGPLYRQPSVELLVLEGRRELELELDGPGRPAGWYLADLGLEAWPSRSTRLPPQDALARAASRGVDYAVVSARDEVCSASLARPWQQAIATGSGSLSVSDDQGTVLAWPVNSNRRKPAHGAVDWYELIAEDILRVAAGSGSQRRLLAVDVPWIEAAGPSWAWDPRPDLLRLEGIDQLELLLELYDGWVDLPPAGPLTWVWLGHEEPHAEELERGLLSGATVATTGPLLRLELDGLPPGETPPTRQPHTVTLELSAPRDVELEGAALVVDGVVVEQWDLRGGREWTRLQARELVSSARYVLAVAWGPQDRAEPQWAVTAPVWTGRP